MLLDVSGNDVLLDVAGTCNDLFTEAFSFFAGVAFNCGCRLVFDVGCVVRIGALLVEITTVVVEVSYFGSTCLIKD